MILRVLMFLLILPNFNFSNGFNIDLIFSLRENFHSGLILFEKQFGNEKVVRKILQHQESRPKAFVGLLDFDDYKSFISLNKNGLVIFDGESDFIKKLIKIQKTDPKLITSFTWIYFMESDDEAQHLNVLNIPYDSTFFLVKELNFNYFEIIDVCQVSSSSFKIYSHYAIWENKKLRSFRKNIFSNRLNLQGIEIKLASLPEGVINLSQIAGTHEGITFWDMFANHMNFTLSKIIVKSVGFSLKNGTKTGTFKLMDDDVVDSSIFQLGVVTERINEYDFIFPTAIVQTKLYVEVKHGLNWKALLTPFSLDIWISIIVWVILAYFLVHITHRMVNPIFKHRLQDPIFNFIRAFSNQGIVIRSTRFSFYICILMPYLLGMVLLQYYSANLLSHLTVKDLKPPFRNLKEVINDGSYEIACMYPSLMWEKISMLINTKAHTKNNLVPVDLRKSLSEDNFHDLCFHRRVCLMGTYNLNVKVNCSIAELADSLEVHSIGAMVKKGFPYRGTMTKLLTRLQASGVGKLYAKNVVKERGNDYTMQPVELNTLFPAFLLLGCFFCLSISVFTFEVIVRRLKEPKENQGYNEVGRVDCRYKNWMSD